jgi:hypothetical protein
MKKIFLALLLVCSNTFAAITDLKLSTSQIFDVQWNISGGTLNASGFNYIYSAVNYATQTNSAARWTAAQTADASSNGRYIGFFNSTTNPGTYGMAVFNSDGTQYKVIDNTGTFAALANGAIFYNGNNQWGTLITTGQGYTNGQSGSWAVTQSNPTNAQLQAYVPPSSTPLAAGQTAQASPPPPTNYTTAAGTMPGGYIGRVLNNTPATWQTYSFTFTPSQTGANYVMLAFRQDPAYWSVDNIKVTAAGSTTNLLQNGGMDTGGTITAQTNNGPTQVSTPTNWGVAYQAGIYPGAAGMWNSNIWYDGAVGSFDAIYQGLNLTAGVTYTLSFMVAGDNTADTNLSGSVQLGVYAGPCGSLSMSPDQCSLPSNSGYTTLATPQEGASAGGGAPTETGSSTSNSTSTSTSTTNTNTINQYAASNYTYGFTGTVTNTTVTTVTTPITTHYWSDGSTTTTTGSSTSSQTVTPSYSIVPSQSLTPADRNPYRGTLVNAITIDQTIGSSSNTVQSTQKGQGNDIVMTVSGVNNKVSANQGFTVNSAGVPSESTMVSNNNFAAIAVSGNNNNVTSQQTGLMNSTILGVTGNYNTVTSTQSGNNNQSYTTVNGNNNTASTNQNGNNNLTALNLTGYGNNITVGQAGNYNGALVSATNAGGPVTVNLLQQAVTQGQTFVVQQTCANGAGCSVSVQQNR